MNMRFYIPICTLFLVLLAATLTSRASTLTVINLNNNNSGSLRQAIIDANPGDKIIFAAGLTGTIHLTSPLLVDKNLTINGPGANILGVEGRSQPTESRVFTLFSDTLRISDLRISNGFSSGAGGGVWVESGGNLTLNNCLINGNVAESAGGVFGSAGSNITITNSTITGNVSFVEGGGVSNRGGTLTIINSTVNGNEAPLGGGISVDNGGTATILNCTISENGNAGGPSGEVGGLRVTPGSTVNLKNTIVAMNNVLGTSIADVRGTVNSQGTNLIGNSTGGNGFIASDLLNVNPLLGTLASNGGATQTQALLVGSPAINAGNNIGAPATDQRGVARPQGAIVDIGSFETGVSLWTGQTNTGSNVAVALGTVTVTFSNVSTAGTTTQSPIDPTTAGNLPGGYSFGADFPAYEITTTAVYTPPIKVCLQVPGATNPQVFNALSIFHSEGGILVNRTLTRDPTTNTICALVNSLSPFVVAQNLAPTAANVTVGGRVLTSNGGGIIRAQVSITNQNGETRWATTNSFGFYHFDEIRAGEAYVINVHHKVYQFSSQVITVSEDIRNADFIAESK